MIVGIHITVRGIVQGVAFRYHTQLKAQELGVAGIVRNESNGSVIIRAAAEESTMLRFLRWCHYGPKNADVQELAYKYIEPESFFGFIIER